MKNLGGMGDNLEGSPSMQDILRKKEAMAAETLKNKELNAVQQAKKLKEQAAAALKLEKEKIKRQKEKVAKFRYDIEKHQEKID